jgi:hypothetical protein
MAQNRDQQRAPVNTTMNIQVKKKLAWNFLTRDYKLLRRTLLRGVIEIQRTVISVLPKKYFNHVL